MSRRKTSRRLPTPGGWHVAGYGVAWTPEEIDRLCGPGGVDAGIRTQVRVLLENSFETVQSCQGAHYDARRKRWSGTGHCYPEPTVEFRGGPGEGFRALALCRERGLQPTELRRVWSITPEGEPDGPFWALTFRSERKPGS
jgi:hypothetical protein